MSSPLPRLSPLAMRQLLLFHTGSKEQSDLRQVVVWLSRFGFTADDVSANLSLTKGEMSDHLRFVATGVDCHQIDTTLYQGNGRYGKLFLVWAKLLQSHTITGELIDAPVRDVLLHVLGLELDLRYLEGFMAGWPTGRVARPVELQSYLEFLLKQGYSTPSCPTTREEFLFGWTSWQAGRTTYSPVTRVVGDDNDSDVIDRARAAVSDGHPST